VQIISEEEKVFEQALFVAVKIKQDLTAKFNFLELENGKHKQISSKNSLDIKTVLLPADGQE